MRDPARGVQPVFRVKRAQHAEPRGVPARGVRRVVAFLLRPSRPRDEREEDANDAEADPSLPQPVLEKQRDERARGGDAGADAREDQAAGEAAPRGRDVGDHRRRGEHHEHAPGEARGEAPAEEPGEAQGIGAAEEGRRGEDGHRPDRDDEGGATGHDLSEQRAGEVARQVGGTEVGRRRLGKPMMSDDRGQQRRVGETRQPDAEQARAERRQDAAPRRRPPQEGGDPLLGDAGAGHFQSSWDERRSLCKPMHASLIQNDIRSIPSQIEMEPDGRAIGTVPATRGMTAPGSRRHGGQEQATAGRVVGPAPPFGVERGRRGPGATDEWRLTAAPFSG